MWKASGRFWRENVVDWFADEHHRQVLDKMRAAGVNMQAEAKVKAGSALEGLTFVLTGTLPTLSRDQAAELIEAHGGKVTSSVSKKTRLRADGRVAGEQGRQSASAWCPDHQRVRSEPVDRGSDTGK